MPPIAGPGSTGPCFRFRARVAAARSQDNSPGMSLAGRACRATGRPMDRSAHAARQRLRRHGLRLLSPRCTRPAEVPCPKTRPDPRPRASRRF
ncbi:hypothetical protein MBELCI_1697 [Limimaricola cinnabarinus LL-001]|uniref:Uncharacterized protein n=1 Tax=Limimaricola cinnabarinus LL-001 TaxID=1337093 RepID=U2Z2N3_9RHOB|nr:hypothetical protein MBELCI_1697 [Limimaricola cinnabarinus LL-001]